MDLQTLKLFSGHYVNESDNLTSSEKLHLIGFIREADKNEVLSLLVTGRVDDVLTEQENLNETELFIENLLEIPKLTKPVYKVPKGHARYGPMGTSVPSYVKTGPTGAGKATAAVAAAAVAAAIITAGVLAYKRFFSKAAKACKGKSGGERKTCLQTFKNNAVIAQMSVLKSGLGKCAKTKNPTKCKLKVQNKIKRLQSKIR